MKVPCVLILNSELHLSSDIFIGYLNISHDTVHIFFTLTLAFLEITAIIIQNA
jgi:hypothetical protein